MTYASFESRSAEMGAKLQTMDIGPDTMIFEGKPISVASEVGALTLLHGALQSSIGTVDAALEAEAAYTHALRVITRA